jgi:hypothetical protein
VAPEVVAWAEQGKVVPPDSNTALLAAEARQNQAQLVTADDHFEGRDAVVFFDKRQFRI